RRQLLQLGHRVEEAAPAFPVRIPFGQQTGIADHHRLHALQVKRRAAAAVEHPGTALQHRIGSAFRVQGFARLALRLHDPQHHEQGHHGQGEVGESYLPGAADLLLAPASTTPSPDDGGGLATLPKLAPRAHAAFLSSSYWLTQASSRLKAGLTSCSMSLRPASTASRVGLPARWATSTVRTHSSADISVLTRRLMALLSGCSRQ